MTKDWRFQDAQQATKSLTVPSYEAPMGSDNYIHINVGAVELAIGDDFKVTFNLAGKSSTLHQDLTYLVRVFAYIA